MSMSMPVPMGEAVARDRAQKIALFRYQLICPALDRGLSTKQRGRIVRELAGREHTDPFGNRRRYCRDTLDRWIRAWRRGGFDALLPQARAFSARTDAAALELAAALKKENPARTAAQVKRILERQTGWSPSESTLLRLFNRLGIATPRPAENGGVFGRFEAAEANERWTGDGLHGPRVGGRKTFLFAFLDDHSRLITGYRFGYSEDTVRLAAALR
ncbi:helix-turn-helix domain-containing protein, partial [Actinokineospora sp.]|uniref:helix-turn-helix domain-containing protein n=1 Tax=Actinokineospora sp. TaxID=1872133 RepID=UPI003D6BECCF